MHLYFFIATYPESEQSYLTHSCMLYSDLEWESGITQGNPVSS